MFSPMRAASFMARNANAAILSREEQAEGLIILGRLTVLMMNQYTEATTDSLDTYYECWRFHEKLVERLKPALPALVA